METIMPTPDSGGSGATAELRARVARLCLPGPMWFIAVCEGCRWVGMSWKDKGWAVTERDQHNAKEHAR